MISLPRGDLPPESRRRRGEQKAALGKPRETVGLQSYGTKVTEILSDATLAGLRFLQTIGNDGTQSQRRRGIPHARSAATQISGNAETQSQRLRRGTRGAALCSFGCRTLCVRKSKERE